MELYRENPDQQATPAMQAPAPRRSNRGAAVLGGSIVAAALIVGGGAYAMADTTNGPSATVTTGSTNGGSAKGRMGMGNGPQQGAESGRPVHGEMVVNDNGSYATVRMQEGTVTAKTSDTVTVKSADGYEQTYKISSTTRFGGGPGMGGMGGPGRGHGHGGPGMGGGNGNGGTAATPTQGTNQTPTHTFAEIKVGDTVHVRATVKDGTATADVIGSEAWREADRAARGWDRDGDDQQGKATQPSGTAAPSATTGTQG